MEESLSEYMLRRFRSAYPSVPITLSKVKAYLDTVDDWRELDDSHLALLYNFNLKNKKGTIMRNSNFNLIKSFGHVGDSKEEHKLLIMEGEKK